ncbi:unnamed protein product [Didymodactylos carnosus]|uniref:Selenoprotein T n=1 Tax=Didymodactylos carnosus TaxID=1234261 RepID=A0A8S2I689_9BILA|nr:unnamed protein product [Didymodactylos carnosus]CAF3702009.1 unnamed protein product [Didymodactylos carnosus]
MALKRKYRNVFEQFSQLIRTHYPQLSVVGENYPPPVYKSVLAQCLSILKMLFLVCIVLGQNPFTIAGLATPSVFQWALQNKIYSCLMLFFFSNSIESFLMSTGAFEIFVNDVPLWSKLQTGHLPSAQDFLQMLQTFQNKENTIGGGGPNIGGMSSSSTFNT